LSFAEKVVDEDKVDSLENRLYTVDGEDKLKLLLNLCQEFVEKDSERCIAYAQEALVLSQELDLSEYQVKALVFLGREDSNLGNYFEGLQKFKKALEISKDNNYNEGVVYAGNEIGITYFRIGSYDEALNHYFNTLKVAVKIGEIEKQAAIKNNIAIIYSINKDHEKALEWFNKVLDVYKTEKNMVRIAMTWVNMANIFDEQGEYEKGLEYLSKAIPVLIEYDEKQMLSSTYNNQGYLFLKQKKYDAAYQNYKRALEIAESIKYERGVVETSINLGEYSVAVKDYNKALLFYESALAITIESSDKEHIKDCYEGIAKVYALKGEFDKALEKTKLFMAYKDEIYNERTQKQISELQIKYETEKKEEEIELLQIRMRTQRRNQMILIVGLLVISFLILRVLHLRQLNLKRKNLLLEQVGLMDKLALEKMDSEKREKDLDNLRLQEEMAANEEINRLKRLKYKEELKHKERELAANALHVVSKNETLESLKKSAEAVLDSDKGEIQRALKRLIQEIDGNINLDQDWEMFKMHFEEVHQGFFKRLVEKYTDLNTNDLRFCAYLRLNLDAKEIARILNISVNAIEKRRYRLRKKLGLDSSDNLFEFLSNF